MIASLLLLLGMLASFAFWWLFFESVPVRWQPRLVGVLLVLALALGAWIGAACFVVLWWLTARDARRERAAS